MKALLQIFAARQGPAPQSLRRYDMPMALANIRISLPGDPNRYIKATDRVGVDTGASGSFMPESMLPIILKGLPSARPIKAMIMTAAGRVSILAIPDVNLCVGKCCGRTNLLFVPAEVGGNLNVGMDFLSHSGAKIDVRKCTMKCGGQTISMGCKAPKR